MLSLAGRIVSRSKPMMRVSSANVYRPKQKIHCTSLEPLCVMNSHNAHGGIRFMSSWTPGQPNPQRNISSDNFVSDPSWEGSILDPGPTLSDNGFGASWTEAVPSQDAIVAAAPTLQELGLGSYMTPVGLLQNVLDMLHSAGLPWWGTIVVTTLALRAAAFPLVLRSQRATPAYMASASELSDKTDQLKKLLDSNDSEKIQRLLDESDRIMKDYRRVAAKQMFPLLVQTPIFLSFFLALSSMAWAPVESMKTGGALWFTDLTVIDPYYLLPVITCVTLSIMVQVGADAGLRADQVPGMKHFLRVMPLVLIPFIMNYPTAVLCYWSTTNFVSLAQVYFLKMPGVRKKLNLPPMSAEEFPKVFGQLKK